MQHLVAAESPLAQETLDHAARFIRPLVAPQIPRLTQQLCLRRR